jgi:hypothetical protein
LTHAHAHLLVFSLAVYNQQLLLDLLPKVRSTTLPFSHVVTRIQIATGPSIEVASFLVLNARLCSRAPSQSDAGHGTRIWTMGLLNRLSSISMNRVPSRALSHFVWRPSDDLKLPTDELAITNNKLARVNERGFLVYIASAQHSYV